jgi:glycosyltransferase involved in cell wall biosynthesis
MDPATGGPVEGILRAAEAWNALGHEREVATIDLATDPWVSTPLIRTHALGNRSAIFRALRRMIPWLRYGFSPRMVTWIYKNSRHYDAVIINGLWNFCSLAAWLALRRSATPYFLFTHGSLDPWFRKYYPIKHAFKQVFWWLIEWRVVRDASAVLFTTEDEKLLAHNSFRPYRCHPIVVGYGTADAPDEPSQQIEAFYRLHPILRGRRFLLFLGRIHRKKGCDLLIRAFANHAANNANLDVVLAGPDQLGWMNELKTLAEDLGIADRLLWTGMLTGDAKWGAYRAAEAFILPSHSENFGIVVAEAMACAKPVLITDKVNIWREIEKAGAGFVCPDTVDGVDAMLARYLGTTAKERAVLGGRARTVFSEHFDINTVSLNLLNMLETSVKTHAASSFSLHRGYRVG